ncbi:hypothetical protein [Xanthobacter agilis]|uniref:Uncharacterized protein n=1 Tax=Xanthobacter agilis TaxID=47492 RepID=A0ABU0LEG1_XANAG|nr:hypothetical protein [Xanthobacter agilis]MDQ0505483.1 hypothetical protein [Xanthobacter agilis]
MPSRTPPDWTPPVSRRHALRTVAAAALSTLAPAAALQALTGSALAQTAPAPAPLGVTVRNQSVAPSCNGPENVALTLLSPAVRRFRISADHPAYVHAMVSEHSVPAYLGCALQAAPAADAQGAGKGAAKGAANGATKADGKADAATGARRTTLYETPDLTVVGYVLPEFWRRAAVPFRVGESATQGLDKVELWLKPADRGATVIELYLADGSWRLRPLPPMPLASTSFSASVLIGPVTQEERLLVKLKEVGFAPQARAFTLRFSDGGTARVRLTGLDTNTLTLDTEFSDGMTTPFAALRANYAVESEADITRVAWRTASSQPFGEAPVMTFPDATDVTLLWAGRLAPARPSLSAPDLLFTGFAGA